MSDESPRWNPVDELAAGAPVDRMRSRLDELLADPPPRRPRPVVWATAAVAAALAMALLLPRGDDPSTSGVPAAVARLEAASTFERLRGVNAAAGLPRSAPLRRALLRRLESDPSINVRLAALDALLAHGGEPPERNRLLRTLEAQPTAIVQAHLGHQLRRRRLVDEAELARIIARPAFAEAARGALERLEEP